MGRRKGGDKKGDGDLKEEEVLQAILLADSFSQAFRPVSLEIPKVSAALRSRAPPAAPFACAPEITGFAGMRPPARRRLTRGGVWGLRGGRRC